MNNTDRLMSFLTAQLDRDEREANIGCGSDRDVFHNMEDVYYPDGHEDVHALRVVAAHRAILAAVEKYLDPHPGQPCTNVDDPWQACDLHVDAEGRVNPYALRILASIYSDRDGYDPAWTASR